MPVDQKRIPIGSVGGRISEGADASVFLRSFLPLKELNAR